MPSPEGSPVEKKICGWVWRRMTLAALRKECKISQATVAEASGIGQVQISRLEKRKDPRLSTMAHRGGDGQASDDDRVLPGPGTGVLIPSALTEKTASRTKRA